MSLVNSRYGEFMKILCKTICIRKSLILKQSKRKPTWPFTEHSIFKVTGNQWRVPRNSTSTYNFETVDGEVHKQGRTTFKDFVTWSKTANEWNSRLLFTKRRKICLLQKIQAKTKVSQLNAEMYSLNKFNLL